MICERVSKASLDGAGENHHFRQEIKERMARSSEVGSRASRRDESQSLAVALGGRFGDLGGLGSRLGFCGGCC